ncbi:hypothetical protein F0344_34530 (plasmid) [Streptomyces finlayi]|uniref:Uncharacterized protein n=1 Tax=Streptomyces finlayi TaxID=67296 RepID=A0A7G7BW72_9ACTN|nr:hypothetical protein [Streptomyces finlayi]QNE79587.1 hypothetical protein F0344_34530 [Streptomyces finlayi]
MLSFRKTFAAVALAAAALMTGPGIASANDYSERGGEPTLYAQCNDFTTQLGVVNVNQGPVCIDFGTSYRHEGHKNGGGLNFSCNAAVTQLGVVNVNQGPVCVKF